MIQRPGAIIATLIATLCAPQAHAANLAECAAIADDRQRLACYDKLAGRRQAE